jgi:hypothetical protein
MTSSYWGGGGQFMRYEDDGDGIDQGHWPGKCRSERETERMSAIV